MPLQLTAPVTAWDLEDFDCADVAQRDPHPPPSAVAGALRAETDRLQTELATLRVEHQTKDDQVKFLSGLLRKLAQGILDFLRQASPILQEASQQEATSRTGHQLSEWHQKFTKTDLIQQSPSGDHVGSGS